MKFIIVKTILTAALFLPVAGLTHAQEKSKEPIGLMRTTGIKAVYQVSEPVQHEGVDKGLFYARKVLKTYAGLGIPATEIDLHLVYHSGAVAALLEDGAYRRLSKSEGANPNKALIAELKKSGVRIEICADTMRQKKIEKTELLGGVDMVAGAFPRLVDLQLAGYPYIKFE